MKDFKFLAGISVGMILVHSVRFMDALSSSAGRSYRSYLNNWKQSQYTNQYQYRPGIGRYEFDSLYDKFEELKYRVDDIEETVNKNNDSKDMEETTNENS